MLLGGRRRHVHRADQLPHRRRAPSRWPVGDLNADGDRDLAVANFVSDDVSVLLGDGDGGTFAAADRLPRRRQAPARWPIGDFNADGDPDLAVANIMSDNVSVLLGDGLAARSPGPTNYPGGGEPTSMAVGDFDADGDPDLAVANSDSSTVSVLLNDSKPAPGA